MNQSPKNCRQWAIWSLKLKIVINLVSLSSNRTRNAELTHCLRSAQLNLSMFLDICLEVLRSLFWNPKSKKLFELINRGLNWLVIISRNNLPFCNFEGGNYLTLNLWNRIGGSLNSKENGFKMNESLDFESGTLSI